MSASYLRRKQPPAKYIHFDGRIAHSICICFAPIHSLFDPLAMSSCIVSSGRHTDNPTTGDDQVIYHTADHLAGSIVLKHNNSDPNNLRIPLHRCIQRISK